MKRIIPLIGLPLLGLGILGLFQMVGPNTTQPVYSTLASSDTDDRAQIWNEAREHYQELRKNFQTQSFQPNDIREAAKAVGQMASSRSLGVDWTEMGPDNIGGRTRALLIDQNNSNRVYAGGVSGGLFVSDNGGGTWTYNWEIAANHVISSMWQMPNGDLYLGTGNTFEGFGSVLFPGTGIYKSVDGGTSFNLLSSTEPITISTTADWSAVNKLIGLPGQSNYIFAGTNRGLKVSADGGQTWSDGLKVNNCQLNAPGQVQDLEITDDGRLFVVFPNGVYASDTPTDPCSFQAVTNGIPSSTWGRMEIAIAPSDNNIMYALTCNAFNQDFSDLLVSYDKGSSWAPLSPGPDLASPDFDLFGAANPVTGNGQGIYDMAIAVDPIDPGRMFIAGVQMHRFDGNWTQASTEAFDNSYPSYYVHADKHSIVFDPNNAQVMYIATDGGVFKSTDRGNTFFAANRGFRITQYYGIGFNTAGVVIGGTQDNGTLEIDPRNTPLSNDAVQVLGGDGFDCDFSQVTGASFASIYFGGVSRDNGVSGMSPIVENAGGPFFTALRLWENPQDSTSKDSVEYAVGEDNVGVGTGDAVRRNFQGTITPIQQAGEVVKNTLRIKAGNQVLRDSDGNGIIDPGSDGTGTVTYATNGSAIFDVTFDQAPASNLRIEALFNVHFEPGDVLIFFSETARIPIVGTVVTPLDSGDTFRVQDPMQSLLAMSVGSGIAITRDGLRFGKLPEWMFLNFFGAQGATCFEFTDDGNHLFVGTQTGNVYRFSGLNNLYTQDDVSTQVTTTVILTANGQRVTGIALAPADQNRLVATLSTYNANGNVALLTDAITRTSAVAANATLVHHNLPKIPVYDAEFIRDYPGLVLIGTDFGIFSIADITDSGAVWQLENGSLPACPVYDIRQQRLDYTRASNHGVIYLGTHGRGIWRSGYFVSTPEYPDLTQAETPEAELTVFPNPMREEGFVRFHLSKAQRVNLAMYDLQGKQVRVWEAGALAPGENNLPLPIQELAPGTYVLSLAGEGWQETQKLMIY
ncbi:MAG: T9SS type A sorting domain-containing protein [Salibacteraceae bacterium]